MKDVSLLLRDDEDLRCDMLEDIVADDMLPDFPRFAVNYHIFSIPKNHHIRLRVPVEDPDDGPETLEAVWSVASWLEIEVWDLMGITFKGNNKLRRLFLPEDLLKLGDVGGHELGRLPLAPFEHSGDDVLKGGRQAPQAVLVSLMERHHRAVPFLGAS